MEPGSTPRPLEQKKKTWRASLPIDMLLSAVSVLVVAQSSSEISEGLMNNPVFILKLTGLKLKLTNRISQHILRNNWSLCYTNLWGKFDSNQRKCIDEKWI